jgi:predicted HicB family RNase H-like nuclease
MNNILKFENNYKAVITYDPDIDMFRGEFIGLNGGADFYARNIDDLKKEGQISLDVFLRMCEQDGVPPRKSQGKFALRLDQETYHNASAAAAANGKSLNQWITETIREVVND